MKTYTNINNAELLRHVDNMPDATPLERELAQRLDEVSEEVEMLQALVPACGHSTSETEDVS